MRENFYQRNELAKCPIEKKMEEIRNIRILVEEEIRSFGQNIYRCYFVVDIFFTLNTHTLTTHTLRQRTVKWKKCEVISANPSSVMLHHPTVVHVVMARLEGERHDAVDS